MTTRISLDERRKALEEEFFKKQERAAIDRLREKQARDHSMAELQALCGMSDEQVLGALVDADVSAETLVAFSLVPLVSMAWASGRVESEERAAVLRAAHDRGIEEGTPAYESLERMLEARPSRRLFEAWADYTRELYGGLGESERKKLAADVLDRARGVAEAAGGFLGIGKASAAEEAVLDSIEAVFR